jgi:rubrerythrin
MFKQKGQATRRGKVWRCKVCGTEWKSTGKHKTKNCPICAGVAWCERHEVKVKRG